jgi:hypothetical protein
VDGKGKSVIGLLIPKTRLTVKKGLDLCRILSIGGMIDLLISGSGKYKNKYTKSKDYC